MMDNAADLTLDELRLALAPAIADSAIFDGWTQAALMAAEPPPANSALTVVCRSMSLAGG